MGDMVSCPLCKGIFPISEGDASLIDDGKPVAYHVLASAPAPSKRFTKVISVDNFTHLSMSSLHQELIPS